MIMNTKLKNKQRGIGLVEVLIALVVVSLGLLGLAKLEGNLLSTSGNNKARAEAIGIAQQQMETIRYAASTQASYADLDDAGLSLVNLNPFNVTGTNAQFTVDIDIEDPDTNSIINTIVEVTWTSAAGDAENITLMSEIALLDIQKSALATNDTAAAVAVPSPRQSASEDVRPASEDVTDPNVISPTATPLPARGTVTADGTRASGLAETFTVNSTDTIPVPYTLTAIANDSRYYNTYFGDGNLAVYVCDSTAVNGCRYIQNHFGGVTLSTAGIIYSAKNTNNDLTGITPVWSSSEVTACYQGAITQTGTGASRVWSMPYECVYAGNCEDDATTCYGHGTGTAVTPAQVAAKGVGPGGEFGNLGLLGLDGSNGGDQLCYLEGTPDWNNSKNVLSGRYDSLPGGQKQYNESYLFPVTARLYVTRRLMSNGEERSEGINKSYRNHKFLLVNRTNNADQYKNCYEAVNETAASLATYVLAPREIVRIRTDNPATNPVEATYTFSGVMPAVTVKTTWTGDIPNIYLPEVGSCYVRTNSAANKNYACVIPTGVASATLYGGSSSVPSPTGADPATPVSFRTCNLIIDTTQASNISASSPSLCAWSAGYP
jgi:Tfp pilus assembly protein PilV